MKYLFRLLFLSAVLSVAGCSDNMEFAEDAVQRNVTISIVADQDDVRTSLDASGTKAKWNSSGEYIWVYESADGKVTKVKSSEAKLNSDGLATFAVTFTSNSKAAEFSYNALYASAVGLSAGLVADVTLASEQKPVVGSYDSRGDILVAQTVEADEQITDMYMSFKRITALACMQLKGLDTEYGVSSIDKVVFTTSADNLAGTFSLDIPNAEIKSVKSGSKSMVLTFATGFTPASPIYFMTLPATLASGEKFTVEVYAGDDIYKKEVLIAANRSIELVAGDIAKFSVDMRNTKVDNGGGEEEPILEVSPTSLNFKSEGGSQTITATLTNSTDAIVAESSNPHFVTSVSKNIITVTAAANTTDSPITATITVKAGTLSKSVSVSQEAAEDIGGGGGNEDITDADLSSIAGYWHLVSWGGDTTLDFDVYLSILSDGNVTLWQRGLASHSWKRYDSRATLVDGVISGKYNDNEVWANSYNVDISADSMTWTATGDAADVSVYERCSTLPDELDAATINSLSPMLFAL